jgi:hypothetical protein
MKKSIQIKKIKLTRETLGHLALQEVVGGEVTKGTICCELTMTACTSC